MKSITIKYGADQHTTTVADGTSVGRVVQNSTTRAMLGYGDNVKALVSGVEQSMDTEVYDGMVVQLETRANSKAA